MRHHPAKLSLFSLLLACGPNPGDAVPVTGKSQADRTWEYQQSETALTIARGGIIVMSFNDETDTNDTISYTDTSRTVRKGASLMGWAYSENNGASWTHGGKVAPPNGYAVLWGDPAIAALQAPNDNIVILSNLAVPEAGYPDEGVEKMSNHVHGAFLARSDDSGRTFHPWLAIATSDFLDGGSMVALSDRAVLAAYYNATWDATDTYLIDVVSNSVAFLGRIQDESRDFSDNGHALARAWGTRPFVLSTRGDKLGTDNKVVLSTLGSDFSWRSTEVWSSSEITGHFGLVLGDRLLRSARNFDMDVGLAEAGDETPEVRILVTYRAPEAHSTSITGFRCDVGLNACERVPAWTVSSRPDSIGDDRFRPRLRYAGLSLAGGMARPLWKATYDSRQHDPNGKTLALFQGNLTNVAWLPLQLTTGHEVCSDLRGYWGDYDEFVVLGAGELGAPVQFLHAFSDSSAGCTRRWQYTSAHLHVSSVRFE